MLQQEYSAILSTYIKLPFVTKIYLFCLFLSGGFTVINLYSKTCPKRPLSKRPIQDQLSLNEGQKYCRMLQREHSAILLTFIKLPSVIKTFVVVFFSGNFLAHQIVISGNLAWDRKSYLTHAILPRLSHEAVVHWLYWNSRIWSSSDIILMFKWCHHNMSQLSSFGNFF